MGGCCSAPATVPAGHHSNPHHPGYGYGGGHMPGKQQQYSQQPPVVDGYPAPASYPAAGSAYPSPGKQQQQQYGGKDSGGQGQPDKQQAYPPPGWDGGGAAATQQAYPPPHAQHSGYLHPSQSAPYGMHPAYSYPGGYAPAAYGGAPPRMAQHGSAPYGYPPPAPAHQYSYGGHGSRPPPGFMGGRPQRPGMGRPGMGMGTGAALGAGAGLLGGLLIADAMTPDCGGDMDFGMF